MPTSKRICMWSGPRNISTAIMYSWAQRKDTIVEDEPLYGYYLAHSDRKDLHPMAEEIISTMENDGMKVIDRLRNQNDAPIYFYKHMTHHLEGLDLDFLSDFEHIILTRDPKEAIPSFAKVIPEVVLPDLGYEQQVDLKRELQERHLKYTVWTAEDFLKDPEKRLRAFCSSIDISFDEAMLSWEPGAIPEDGIWAPHWYSNVHQSTGFRPYQPKEDSFPEAYVSLLDQAMPLYQELLAP